MLQVPSAELEVVELLEPIGMSHLELQGNEFYELPKEEYIGMKIGTHKKCVNQNTLFLLLDGSNQLN